MKKLCKICGKETASAHSNIMHGICEACALRGVGSSNNDDDKLLEAIHAPILLMQGNPRQVVSANKKALDLFGKELREVESHRGGQVFDCIHSFTEAGCGKDVNCENCKIKDAIVDTFTTAKPHTAFQPRCKSRRPMEQSPTHYRCRPKRLATWRW